MELCTKHVSLTKRLHRWQFHALNTAVTLRFRFLGYNYGYNFKLPRSASRDHIMAWSCISASSLRA